MSEPLHLFCVPYAGGSAVATYSRWGRHLPAAIKLIPLELPGRGRRTPEPPKDAMDALIADLLDTVMPVARSGAPYAFYGHSMGTSIVYELVRALADAGMPPPRTLFLSGRNPPHKPYSNRHLHLLSDTMFLEEMRKLGGTPDEFFRMHDLVRAFLPIVRNDYRLIEMYQPDEAVHATSSGIVFLCSDADPLLTRESILDWQRYSTGMFCVHPFSGGHFFINDHYPMICTLIAATLEETMP